MDLRRGRRPLHALTPLDRRDAAFAALAALVPLAVGVGWRLAEPGACLFGEDAALWAIAADGLREGRLEPLAAGGRQPVQPALVALFSVVVPHVPDAAYWVSVGATAALGAGSYLLARVLFGRAAGLFAAGATLQLPVVHRMANANADPLFLLAFLGVTAALVGCWRRPGARTAAIAGAAVGLASLTKPSALLLLPALAWIGGRGGVRAAGAALAGFLLLAAPWALVERALTGTASAPLAIVTANLAGGGGPDKLASTFELHGLDTAWLREGPLWRVLGTVRGNVVRLGGEVLRSGHLLLWLPVAAWLARRGALPGRRDLPPLLLVTGSAILALPVLWQPRHVLPFLLVGALAASSVVPALLRRSRPLALLALLAAVLPALAAPPLALGQWRVLATRNRCDPAAATAGAWLRENVGRDGAQLLAQRNEALRYYGAMVLGGEDWAIEAFTVPGSEGPAEPATLWLVDSPLLPEHRRLAPLLGRLHPDAELVWTGEVPGPPGRPPEPVRVFRRTWAGAGR